MTTIDAVRMMSLSKRYGSAAGAVTALDDITVSLATGTFTAVMGPSGSGKSTLLHCAAGLELPTSGRVFVAGAEMTATDETALTKFRRERIGFVFQDFNLMPALTVLQNVTLPLRLAGRRVDLPRCRAVLQRVGLHERLQHRPGQLSGGQRQRAAIARALITEPAVVFADEPTGALDTRNAREVLGLLREAVRDYGRTVVMVTHDPVAAAHADAVLFMSDGRIVGEMVAPTADGVAARLTHLGDGAGRPAIGVPA